MNSKDCETKYVAIYNSSIAFKLDIKWKESEAERERERERALLSVKILECILLIIYLYFESRKERNKD